MRKISIEELRPGMKLARPVTNRGGMIILPEDTEVTAAQIDRMRNMDIQAVFVHGLSGSVVSKEEMLGGLEERFAGAPNEFRLAVLKKVMRDHLEGLNEG